MGAFRKFKKNDVLFSTIHARPHVSAKYGANGWEGNTGPSASLSLYGGVRARSDVKSGDLAGSGISIYPLDPLDTHSIDKVIFVSGSYPSTGSIRYARCLNRPYGNFTEITPELWFDEHYSPIDGLFDYYHRFDSNYFTGSYDFYSTLLLADNLATASLNSIAGPHFIFSGALDGFTVSGSSFTALATVKPLVLEPVTGSVLRRHTVFAQKDLWSLQVTQSGTALFVIQGGFQINSTARLNMGSWNSFGVTIRNGFSASFHINGVTEDFQTLAIPIPSSSDSDLIVGANVNSFNQPFRGFNGFLFDTQIWNRELTTAERALAVSGTLINSGTTDLIHYSRFNDGPSGAAHGFASGSGAFDHSFKHAHGHVYDWSFAHRVRWEPSDHPTFVAKLEKTNLDIRDLRVVHVPSMFYGRQISPGTVRITDGAFNKRKIVRVFNDDGRGSLYVSGSMTRSITGEEYEGNTRRKVGNVFYTEGLIVLTDPALYDVFDTGSVFWGTEMGVSGVFGDLFSVDFKGETRIHTKVFNCRMTTAQANASNNLTFSYIDDRGTEATDDDRTIVVGEDGTTWITAVGLYNEDRKLVAVAKLAQPIRKREKEKINIRLKMDF